MRIFLISILFFSYVLSKEICIKNFNKTICSDFKILNSVIIKTHLSKKEISNKLHRPVQQIAFLENTNLYLIKTDEPLRFTNELLKLSYIIYAQPNISQFKKNFAELKIKKIQSLYNLDKVWKRTKGDGVNIAIIDDGFDLMHEDLKDVNLIFSYDVDNKNLNYMPKYAIDKHGTQVAGIIFSNHNSIGIDGIAPNANFIAIRQTTNTTSDTILAFTVAKKAGANIINCSWNSPILLEPVFDVIKAVSKNTAIVFAAGNKHKYLYPYSTEAAIPEVITVASFQNYSNYGKMVDFILPSNILTTNVNGGYNIFNGTSASAPILTGLLALKMSEQKNKEYKILVNQLKKKLIGSSNKKLMEFE